MQIRLRTLSAFEKVTSGDLVIELKDGNTAKDLLEKMDVLYGKEFEKKTGEKIMEAIKRYNMIVNKKVLRFPKDLKYAFSDNDFVVLLHVTGGG